MPEGIRDSSEQLIALLQGETDTDKIKVFLKSFHPADIAEALQYRGE